MAINDLIQQIVALANIKNQREQTALEGRKVDILGQSTAQADKIAMSKRVDEALATMSTLPGRAREEFVASMRGVLPTEIVDRLSTSLPGMTDSPEVVRRAAIQHGRAIMSPTEQDRISREAATGAVTGMSRGGTAESDLQATLLQSTSPESLNSLFGPGGLAAVSRAAITKTAAGVSPDELSIGNKIATTPSLVTRGADVRTGGLTEAQRANIPLSWADLNERIDSAAKGRALGWAQLAAQTSYWEAEARGKTGVTPAQQMDARHQLLDLTTTMSTKPMNDEARKLFAAQYNEYARMLGLPMIGANDDLPAAVRGIKALFGGGNSGTMPTDSAYTRGPVVTPGLHP